MEQLGFSPKPPYFRRLLKYHRIMSESSIRIPEDLRYTEEHEWVRREGDLVVVGITDYAQRELGDIVFVEIEKVGEQVAQREVLGTIEAVKTVADLYSPLSGEVVEANESLQTEAEKINQDPYGEGWIVKIRPSDPAEWDHLLTADDYRRLIGE